jgi:hypothetical protein
MDTISPRATWSVTSSSALTLPAPSNSFVTLSRRTIRPSKGKRAQGASQQTLIWSFTSSSIFRGDFSVAADPVMLRKLRANRMVSLPEFERLNTKSLHFPNGLGAALPASEFPHIGQTPEAAYPRNLLVLA